MKRLILTRHAKSAWDDPLTPDHDRPLNERGKAAAARIDRMMITTISSIRVKPETCRAAPM